MKSLGTLVAIVVTTSVVSAQSQRMTPGKVKLVGSKTTREIQQKALSIPVISKYIYKEKENEEREDIRQNPLSPITSMFPITVNDDRRILAPAGKGRSVTPYFSLGTGFNGPDRTVAVDPPDTVGDVSTTQVVVSTNDRIRVYSRTGVLGSLNVTQDAFFASALQSPPSGGFTFTSDPRVRFDRTSGRWFLATINVVVTSGGTALQNNRCIVAVSNGSVIDASTVWSFYFFTPRLATDFFDYPTLGVDNNAVYIGGNMFGTSSFTGCDAYVMKKAPMLTGAATSVFSSQVCTASGEGPYTPQGVVNGNPATTEGYFVGVSNAAFGRLVVRRVTDPGGTPSISGNLLVTVPTTNFPGATVSTPGGGLDALDDRLFNAMYSNGSIWCAHNFRVTTAGVATNTGSRFGSRWYQVGSLTGTPTLVQSGTVFDNAASGFQNYWIPSIAANLQGHAVLGGTRANSATTPGSGYAVRSVTDTLGTMSAPALAKAGTGTFTPQGNRWGDYSHVVVDPSDGMTFWSFQTYVPSAGKWGTWVQEIKSNAPTVSSLVPNAGLQGQTLNVVVNGTDLFDPGAGYPNHLTANFGANITINSVTYTSPTQATVNITVGAAAATGSRSVTITNPDGQSTTSSFTVNQAVKTVSGTLSLQSYVGSESGLQFVYELRDATTNTLIETQTLTGLGAGNTFSLNTNQPAGTYKLRIRGINRFLASSQTITVTATGISGLSYTLLNGDASPDNVVGTADFNVIRAAWGALPTDPNWNEAADLNGDGVVGTADFNILRSNWGVLGDN